LEESADPLTDSTEFMPSSGSGIKSGSFEAVFSSIDFVGVVIDVDEIVVD